MIGTMNITRTIETGEFHCPSCGSLREYRLRSRRPFLTIYFIPAVPIGGAELIAQCRQCHTNWDVSVLDPDAARMAEQVREKRFHEEAMRAATLAVIADGEITPAEIDGLLRVSDHLLDEPLTREDLGYLCSSAMQNGVTADNYLRTVAKNWTAEQRSFALQAIFVAITSEGAPTPEQLKVVAKLRDPLDMTDGEYQAAIEAAIDWE